MNKAHIDQIRSQIIAAALPDIPFDGWKWDVIIAAGAKSGHNAHIVETVFPEKVIDALDAFAKLADREMLNHLKQCNIKDMRTHERIIRAVIARLEFLQTHREAVRESLKFWTMPQHKIRGAHIAWQTSDTIWNWAGDRTKDYNHYTKRGLLSGIVVSVMLFWVNDDSPDINNTRTFLMRRINNVLKIGRFIGQFKKEA